MRKGIIEVFLERFLVIPEAFDLKLPYNIQETHKPVKSTCKQYRIWSVLWRFWVNQVEKSQRSEKCIVLQHKPQIKQKQMHQKQQ